LTRDDELRSAQVRGTTPRDPDVFFEEGPQPVLSTLEALGHLTRGPVPSAGDLVARYLHRTILRAVAIAVWLYAGWHLFSH
jgi:hypothetical protein